MATVTIPKTQYESLKKRALLYDAVLRSLPERKWGIERYTAERVREFMREDRLSPQVRAKLRKRSRVPK